jgi:hypothetical protein
MNNAVIFNHCILTDGDFAEVAPDHGSRPYRTILANLDITDNVSRLADKG